MAEMLPPPEQDELDEIRSALNYCPLTGSLTWKRRASMPARWNTRWSGKPAGSIDSKGYLAVRVNYQRYRAHRVIWFLMTDLWPTFEIDHENLNPLDNRWSNLREADHAQNGCNKRAQSNNTSGFKGVSWHAGAGKWLAQIVFRGKHTSIGLFSDPAEAHAAYCAAAADIHREFANTGLNGEIDGRLR